MRTSTTHASGPISARSIFSAEAREIAFGEFDVMVLTSSWDERCAIPLKATALSARIGILILFDEHDPGGLRAKNDKLLLDWLQSHSETVRIVRGSAMDVFGVWAELFQHVKTASVVSGRPLSIFIEASTCPRFHTLATMAMSLTRGLASTVSLMYSEGSYPERAESREVAFTRGAWETVPVPALEGRYDPEKKRFYLASLGFEGWKTLRVVARADPDRVSVLLPNPGTHDEYASRARNNNRTLLEQYCIPEEQQLIARAADAVEGWRTLSTARLERPDSENTFFLCTGTKAHSIALALRAMEVRSAALLYCIPEAHHPVPITAAGVFWRYEVRSTTTPV